METNIEAGEPETETTRTAAIEPDGRALALNEPDAVPEGDMTLDMIPEPEARGTEPMGSDADNLTHQLEEEALADLSDEDLVELLPESPDEPGDSHSDELFDHENQNLSEGLGEDV